MLDDRERSCSVSNSEGDAGRAYAVQKALFRISMSYFFIMEAARLPGLRCRPRLTQLMCRQRPLCDFGG